MRNNDSLKLKPLGWKHLPAVEVALAWLTTWNWHVLRSRTPVLLPGPRLEVREQELWNERERSLHRHQLPPGGTFTPRLAFPRGAQATHGRSGGREAPEPEAEAGRESERERETETARYMQM